MIDCLYTARSLLPQNSTTIPGPQRLGPAAIADIFGEEYRRLEVEREKLEGLKGHLAENPHLRTARMRKHANKRLRDVRWKLEALKCPFQDERETTMTRADGGWTYARGTHQARLHPAIWIQRLLPNWEGIMKRSVLVR